jgi:helicase associated protein
LSVERKQRLEALPGWVWNLPEAEWAEAYERLRRYWEREGSPPPRSYRDPDGFPLGTWVDKHRQLEKSRPDSERARRLAELPDGSGIRRTRHGSTATSALSVTVSPLGTPRRLFSTSMPTASIWGIGSSTNGSGTAASSLHRKGETSWKRCRDGRGSCGLGRAGHDSAHMAWRLISTECSSCGAVAFGSPALGRTARRTGSHFAT